MSSQQNSLPARRRRWFGGHYPEAQCVGLTAIVGVLGAFDRHAIALDLLKDSRNTAAISLVSSDDACSPLREDGAEGERSRDDSTSASHLTHQSSASVLQHREDQTGNLCTLSQQLEDGGFGEKDANPPVTTTAPPLRKLPSFSSLTDGELVPPNAAKGAEAIPSFTSSEEETCRIDEAVGEPALSSGTTSASVIEERHRQTFVLPTIHIQTQSVLQTSLTRNIQNSEMPVDDTSQKNERSFLDIPQRHMGPQMSLGTQASTTIPALPLRRQRDPTDVPKKSHNTFMRMMELNKRPSADITNCRITAEEVRAHNKPEDAWVIYNGRVFNITPFLDYHPGGRRLLISVAGKDCTSEYNKYHPWVSCDAVLGKCQVGVTGRPKR